MTTSYKSLSKPQRSRFTSAPVFYYEIQPQNFDSISGFVLPMLVQAAREAKHEIWLREHDLIDTQLTCAK